MLLMNKLELENMSDRELLMKQSGSVHLCTDLCTNFEHMSMFREENASSLADVDAQVTNQRNQ